MKRTKSTPPTPNALPIAATPFLRLIARAIAAELLCSKQDGDRPQLDHRDAEPDHRVSADPTDTTS